MYRVSAGVSIKSAAERAGRQGVWGHKASGDREQKKRKKTKRASRGLVRTVIATMAAVEVFGYQVAVEVYKRGLDLVSAVSLQSVEGVSENSGEDGLGEGCMVGL